MVSESGEAGDAEAGQQRGRGLETGRSSEMEMLRCWGVSCGDRGKVLLQEMAPWWREHEGGREPEVEAREPRWRGVKVPKKVPSTSVPSPVKRG